MLVLGFFRVILCLQFVAGLKTGSLERQDAQKHHNIFHSLPNKTRHGTHLKFQKHSEPCPGQFSILHRWHCLQVCFNKSRSFKLVEEGWFFGAVGRDSIYTLCVCIYVYIYSTYIQMQEHIYMCTNTCMCVNIKCT